MHPTSTHWSNQCSFIQHTYIHTYIHPTYIHPHSQHLPNRRTSTLTHSLSHTDSRDTHTDKYSFTHIINALTHSHYSLTHFGGNGSVRGRWRSGRDRTSGSDDDSTQYKHIFSMHLTNIHIFNSIQPTNILHPFNIHSSIQPKFIHSIIQDSSNDTCRQHSSIHPSSTPLHSNSITASNQSTRIHPTNATYMC